VSQFVQRGLMWESGNGIHCDFTTASEASNVAVQLIKRRPRDVQGGKSRVDVKAGNRGNAGVFTFGLCEHKPIRPKPEGAACLWFGCFLLDGIGLGSSLERHGHAKGDSFLPFADLPFPFKPSAVRVEWSGLQVAPRTLFQRKQGVPERKCEFPDYVEGAATVGGARPAPVVFGSRCLRAVNIVRPEAGGGADKGIQGISLGRCRIPERRRFARKGDPALFRVSCPWRGSPRRRRTRPVRRDHPR
jgi:hypothetical protein